LNVDLVLRAISDLRPSQGHPLGVEAQIARPVPLRLADVLDVVPDEREQRVGLRDGEIHRAAAQVQRLVEAGDALAPVDDLRLLDDQIAILRLDARGGAEHRQERCRESPGLDSAGRFHGVFLAFSAASAVRVSM
jgi:hypothetical protein